MSTSNTKYIKRDNFVQILGTFTGLSAALSKVPSGSSEVFSIESEDGSSVENFDVMCVKPYDNTVGYGAAVVGSSLQSLGYPHVIYFFGETNDTTNISAALPILMDCYAITAVYYSANLGKWIIAPDKDDCIYIGELDGDTGNYPTFGEATISYGEGKRIRGFCDAPIAWESTGSGVYAVYAYGDLGLYGSHDGYTWEEISNLGYMVDMSMNDNGCVIAMLGESIGYCIYDSDGLSEVFTNITDVSITGEGRSVAQHDGFFYVAGAFGIVRSSFSSLPSFELVFEDENKDFKNIVSSGDALVANTSNEIWRWSADEEGFVLVEDSTLSSQDEYLCLNYGCGLWTAGTSNGYLCSEDSIQWENPTPVSDAVRNCACFSNPKWYAADVEYIKVSGAWKQVDEMYTKVSGSWK